MGLPTGYKQLAYIESAGTQYIDAAFIPNNNTRVVMDAQLVSTSGTFGLFGVRTSATSNNYALIATGGTYRSDYNTVYTQTWDATLGDRHVIDKNKETTTINGVSQSYTNEAFQCEYNLTLLALNNAGAVRWFASAKLYSCQIYDNGTLVRNYVPCLNDSSEAGLYDLVNAEFYSDAAGGSFTAGPEITTLPAPSDFTASSAVNSITLSWGAVSNAVGYILRRNGLQIADTTETEYTDITAKPYRIYTYLVSAYDDEAESEAATLTASVLESNGFVTVDYRTAADVERVKNLQNRIESGKATEAEIVEWLDGLIGAYNAWDMNRVESAVDFLQTYLNGVQTALDAYRAERMVASDAFWIVPWDAISLVTKKDWVLEDIPSESDLARYLSNVDALTEAISISKNLPDTMERLNYVGANEIERALRAEYDAGIAYETNMKNLIDNTKAAIVYSGEIYGGELDA